MSTIAHERFEAVIGLEVHAQLLTKSKAFAPVAPIYGEAPNTMVTPLCLGHPGTLPVVNENWCAISSKWDWLPIARLLKSPFLHERIISILIYQKGIRFHSSTLQYVTMDLWISNWKNIISALV